MTAWLFRAGFSAIVQAALYPFQGGRAIGLHPTTAGEKLMREAVTPAKTLEEDATTS